MVIHGVRYRPLDYQPTSRWRRGWPIAWNEFRSMFKMRWGMGIFLFILCFVPSLISLGWQFIYHGAYQIDSDVPWIEVVVGRTPRLNPASISFYLDPILRESFWVFMVLTTLVSCRAVAKDRPTDALEIYWTRGISPWGYFLAKWAGSFLLMGTVFIAAPLVVWLVGVAMASDWTQLEDSLWFMPRVMVGLIFMTAVLTYAAVAFSAFSRTPNRSSLIWAFFILGTAAAGRVLSRVFRGEYSWKAIDPWDSSKRLVEWFAGVSPWEDYDPTAAFVCLGVTLALLTIGLYRRLRHVEVIA